MRIKIITLTGLLLLGTGTAMAQPAVQDVKQDNSDIRELNKDIRNNEGDLKKDKWDAAHDQRDINRDRNERSADQAREDRDLSDGDLKGAKYWNRQRKDETAEIRHDKKDLAHSRLDVHNAKGRLAKDVKVRNHDVAKRNKAAGKI